MRHSVFVAVLSTVLIVPSVIMVTAPQAKVATEAEALTARNLPGAPSLRAGVIRRNEQGRLVLMPLKPGETASYRPHHERTEQKNQALRIAAGSCPLASGSGKVSFRPPRAIADVVRRLAPEHGVDPRLVLAVMAVESSFRVNARSHRNAQGLMQLIPATAKRFGVRDAFDPEQNIRSGIRYLSWLIDRFDGNLDNVLAAYNAGERNVHRYRGIPPFPETQRYVVKVQRIYRCAEQIALRKVEPTNG